MLNHLLAGDPFSTSGASTKLCFPLFPSAWANATASSAPFRGWAHAIPSPFILTGAWGKLGQRRRRYFGACSMGYCCFSYGCNCCCCSRLRHCCCVWHGMFPVRVQIMCLCFRIRLRVHERFHVIDEQIERYDLVDPRKPALRPGEVSEKLIHHRPLRAPPKLSFLEVRSFFFF